MEGVKWRRGNTEKHGQTEKKGLKQTQLNILHPFKTKKKKKTFSTHLSSLLQPLHTSCSFFQMCWEWLFFFFFFLKSNWKEPAHPPRSCWDMKIYGWTVTWYAQRLKRGNFFLKKIWQKSCRTLREEGTDVILADAWISEAQASPNWVQMSKLFLFNVKMWKTDGD